MKASSEETNLMEKAERYLPTESTTLEILLMEKPMDTVYSKISMEVNMKVAGKKISNMALEKRYGIMEQKPMREILLKGKRMEKANLCGAMALTMKVILLIAYSKASALISSKRKIKLTMGNSMRVK